MNSVGPSKLRKPDKKKLIELFDSLKVNFPPLIDQCKDDFEARTRIDLAFLSILGHDKGDAEKFVEEMHHTLYDKLSSLKEAMKED